MTHYPHAIAIQADGKIVAAGTSSSASSKGDDFALARYSSSGSLDSTFSGDGKVVTDFNNRADGALAMAIQRINGKIVVAGGSSRISGAESDFALARYHAFSCNGFNATRVGAMENDTLLGTLSNDVIVGLGGNDTISGLLYNLI